MRKLLLLLALIPSLSWAVINAADFQWTVETCGDGSATRKSEFPDGLCVPPNVYWTTDFEEGYLLNNSVIGGWGMQAIENNQAQTACEFTIANDGGLAATGPDADMESRVVNSGTAVGADTPDARAGAYFMKFSVDYTHEYEQLNTPSSTCEVGYAGNDLDKPRTKFYNDTLSVIDWDTEVWLGYSVYLPSDFKHEIHYTGTDQRMTAQHVSIVADSSMSHVIGNLYVFDGTTSDWVFQVGAAAGSVSEAPNTKSTTIAGCDASTTTCMYYLKLGDTVADGDLGEWTDFVVRMRFNPYPSGTTCNPSTGTGTGICATIGAVANTQNRSITGGTGLLQVWKSVGTAGSSTLTVTNITQANPGVITYTGTDPANGDTFYLTGVTGMTEANSKYVKVSAVNAGANTFSWVDPDDANVDTSGFTAYSASGTLTPSRGMSLVLDENPMQVGLLPGTQYPTIKLSPRIYKYGWKKHTTVSTNPVEIAFDEWRMGRTATDGTGYADVHPSGHAQP